MDRYRQSRDNPNAKKSVGLDSSKFAIAITQYVDGKIQVIHTEEYDGLTLLPTLHGILSFGSGVYLLYQLLDYD